MRLFGWLIVGLVLGVMLGAFGGLIVATLLNDNCSSFSEQLAGCTRYSVSGVTQVGAVVGAGAGFLLGVMIGAILQLRHERARKPV